VLDTLCQMDVCHEPGDEDLSGYLAEVPVLEQVAPAVQVDLLADAWRRHRAPERHEASLLDAAVVLTASSMAPPPGGTVPVDTYLLLNVAFGVIPAGISGFVSSMVERASGPRSR